MNRPAIFSAPVGVRTRTALACLQSAERELRERRVALHDLAGDTVTFVSAHQGGTLMCFRSGATLVLPRGAVFDAAGLPVIEP